MTTINSIANLLVNCGLTEAEAFEMAEHEYNVAPTYTELAQMDAEALERLASEDYDDWGDYDDWDDFEDEPAVIYLDEVLNGLDKDVNVVIYLNSARIIYGGMGVAPILTQDCIGNHTARNWCDALSLIHTHHCLDGHFAETQYRVLSIVHGDNNTVSVYLDATRDDNSTVHGFEYAGNLYAHKNAFRY